MRIHNVRPYEYTVKPGVVITAISVGSKGPGQSLFLIPVRAPEEAAREDEWDIRPTSSGKPQIVANSNKAPGLIIRLSTFNRPGKRNGKLFVNSESLPAVQCIGYGIAGDPETGVMWEEAVIKVDGPALFYLLNVGPPNELIVVSDDLEGVIHQPVEDLEPGDSEYIRIDDPRITRWISEEHYGRQENQNRSQPEPQ